MEKEIITDSQMQILSVRVPTYIHRRVHTIAEQREQTVSNYMREVLKEGIKRQKK